MQNVGLSMCETPFETHGCTFGWGNREVVGWLVGVWVVISPARRWTFPTRTPTSNVGGIAMLRLCDWQPEWCVYVCVSVFLCDFDSIFRTHQHIFFFRSCGGMWMMRRQTLLRCVTHCVAICVPLKYYIKHTEQREHKLSVCRVLTHLFIGILFSCRSGAMTTTTTVATALPTVEMPKKRLLRFINFEYDSWRIIYIFIGLHRICYNNVLGWWRHDDSLMDVVPFRGYYDICLLGSIYIAWQFAWRDQS